ncbi:tryptophan--tRNA ligase [bacterium]|nr:MAG: tryptophan--tRNA ligase [bacterium]
MNKPVIVSGIKPSGKLHIGNYLGALANWVELQKNYECFFFVADMHSLTETYKPEEKRADTLNIATDLLALGIDPENSAIFVQSQIPEHAELTWYFNTLTPVAFLERMTQYKDFISRGHAANAGLFDYPVLQAADILLYKPYGVPVGEDQLQHLELTNDIVKKFNGRFGQTFTAVKPLLTQTPRVMSLLDPSKKMSKSLGEGHVLNLSDDAKTIEKKLARAVTDTGKDKKMSAGVQNLFQLLEIFGEPEQHKFYAEAHKTGTIRYSDLKTNLAKVIAHHFAEYRTKRAELEKTPKYIAEVIARGREKARAIAGQTLQEIKEKMGLLL